MGLIEFLFGKKPKINFEKDGSVRHDHTDKKWDDWKNRFAKNLTTTGVTILENRERTNSSCSLKNKSGSYNYPHPLTRCGFFIGVDIWVHLMKP